MSGTSMTHIIAFIHHHSANDRERLEGLFPVARELIQRAMVVVKHAEDGTPYNVAQSLRDTFKGDAQTFLDATLLLSKDALAADRRRAQNEAGSRR
jgi:hypothetical protein